MRVAGGPRERGRQYGEQARERVRRSVEAYAEVFARCAGWDRERARAEAARFELPIAEYGSAYLDELRGIAEGAGLPLEDVLAVNVRTEVMYAAKARDAAAATECTAVAVLPEASAESHTLVGQNWDWLLHAAETVVVLEAEQEDGPDYVTVVEAGLLAKTGLNSAGVGLVTNALATDLDLGEPGVPYHVVLRAILDAETIADALAAVQRRPRASAANYLIAHADGLAVDVEAAPGDYSRLRLLFPEEGLLLHANHFVAPDFALRDVSLWAMPDSPFRLERLRGLLAAARPALAVEDLQRAFGDHAGHPFGICCHPDPRAHPLDRSATEASLVIDLDARRLWLADGSPCVTAFRELDYAGFLAKPPLPAAART